MKLMKYIRIILCLVLIPFCVSCSNNEPPDNGADFVGIAIFQNSTENTKWNSIYNDKTLINNIIETKDNKIVYNSNPEFLFYVYSQNKINDNTKDNDYITNTTKDETILSNNTLKFTLERIAENTDVLIYFIYKINGEYYLEFKKEQSNITSETETILIDIDHENFNKINIILKTNLSVKKEY